MEIYLNTSATNVNILSRMQVHWQLMLEYVELVKNVMSVRSVVNDLRLRDMSRNTYSICTVTGLFSVPYVVRCSDTNRLFANTHKVNMTDYVAMVISIANTIIPKVKFRTMAV